MYLYICKYVFISKYMNLNTFKNNSVFKDNKSHFNTMNTIQTIVCACIILIVGVGQNPITT